MLPVLTFVVCVCGAMADGPLRKIEPPESVMELIPPTYLKPLDSLNESIEKLNGMLDMKKWTELLSSSGEAGKAVLTSLKSLIVLFVKGEYKSLFAIADVANDGYKAVGQVRKAIEKVNAIPLSIPGLKRLDGALETMETHLGVVRCIKLTNCFFGGRRSIDETDHLQEFEANDQYN